MLSNHMEAQRPQFQLRLSVCEQAQQADVYTNVKQKT